MTAAAVTAGDLDILTGIRIDTPWGNSIIEGSRAAKDGQYATSATAFERALPLISISSPEDRMDLALALGGLGNCYAKMGRYAEAQPFDERALALWRELLPRGVMVAVELNNVAGDYSAGGHFEEALRYQSEALRVDEAALGPRDALVANDWNNLGVTYILERRYSAADKALRRAIEVGSEMTPPHPRLTEFNGNMASLMLALHRPKEAKELQERVLSTQVKERGLTHVSVGMTLMRIADCEIMLKKYALAVGHASAAIRILKDRLGEWHPRIGTAYFELAVAYQRLRRSDLAEPAIESVLAIDKQATVRPSMRSAHLREYALVLRKRGKKDEAKAAELMAAKIEQQDMGQFVSRETVDVRELGMR
jgi:tetratricopeptide (TPR) repeat protein